MKKAGVLFLTVLLVFIFCCELKASSLQKSIVPAEALWVVHFDLVKFKASRLGDIVLNKIEALGLKDEVGQFHKQFKMDILNDIEGVTAIGLGKDEEDIVVCLKGNINKEFLLGLLGMEDSHQEIPYGKYTLHNWDKDEFGAFVDDDLVLIAHNKNALISVVDVISGKAILVVLCFLDTHLNFSLRIWLGLHGATQRFVCGLYSLFLFLHCCSFEIFIFCVPFAVFFGGVCFLVTQRKFALRILPSLHGATHFFVFGL